MQEKYAQLSGRIATHIWVFATLLAELQKTPNREKTREVYNRALWFAEDQEVRFNATQEEINDLKTVVEALQALL